MYVSLSCVELAFVHLSLALQVQTFTPKFFLPTLIHVYDIAKENLALHEDLPVMTRQPNPIWHRTVKLWTERVKKKKRNLKTEKLVEH